MIKKFEDYRNGYGFLIPSSGGPGAVQHAPLGDPPKIKKFQEFEGEYRKGSNKFGGIVNDIMMFLRIYKEGGQKDILKFRIDKFQEGSNIDIKRIKQLLDSDTNLLSFDIEIDDEYITFSNLNKVYKNRFVWGENKTFE